jgi:hypothetical protein
VAASDREALVLMELVMSRVDTPGPLANFAQRFSEFSLPQPAAFLGTVYSTGTAVGNPSAPGVLYSGFRGHVDGAARVQSSVR